MADAERIAQTIKRAEKAEARRDSFQPLMADIHRFFLPERDGWNSYGYGSDRHIDVYDSGAVTMASRFANRVQTSMFPPGQRWSLLSLPPELAALDSAQQTQEMLEDATAMAFRHLHASNFDAEMNAFCHDIGAMSGCMLIENGRLGRGRPDAPLIRCQSVPSGLVAYDEGPWGTVEGVFFTQKMPGRLLMRTYPDATIPQALGKSIDQDGEAEISLLLATTYDPEAGTGGGWRFEVIQRSDKSCLVERVYRTNPWIIGRWTKAAGEVEGRGPLCQALPDARTTNKMLEWMMRREDINALGVWTAMNDGVLNPDVIEIVGGAIIPVRSNGGPMGPALKALEMGGNTQFSVQLLEFLQTRMRQTLFDNPLPPEVQVGLTATEVIERMRQLQQDTGSFGRLHADVAVPVMIRVVDILEEAGEFSAPKFKGLSQALRTNKIQIRVVSPLAQAQDRADVQSIMSMIGAAAQMGEFGMAMLSAGVDPERAGRFTAQRSGIPHSLIPTESEIAAKRKAAEQAAQMQTLAQSPVAAQAVGAAIGGAMRNAAPQSAPAESA